MSNRERIKELNDEISKLQKQLDVEELLQELWNELGPYSDALSNGLRYKLQDYFGFDDSE
jgi:hypothetical protein